MKVVMGEETLRGVEASLWIIITGILSLSLSRSRSLFERR